jgi:hypothetical protein
MALQKNLTLTNNFDEQSEIDCYIRVAETLCSKTQCIAKFDVLRNNTDQVLEKRDHLFALDVTSDAKNVWEQAYNALKLIDEFSDAEDC